MSADERTIIERVLAGDDRAFRALAERHQARAMTLAVRMLKNREDAEEALQDAFLRAYRSLDRFKLHSSFATWLYRIIFNVCSTRLRGRSSEVRVDVDEQIDMIGESDDRDRPDLQLESAELHEIVQRGIDAMPGVYAGVFTLFFVQDLSYEEIAEVTDIPLNTVKTRLFRARRMLRAYVLEHRGETVSGGSMVL